MKQTIKLNETQLKQLVKKVIMESYSEARPYSAKLYDMIDNGLINTKQLAESLIGYMSDDEVGRFMDNEGYSEYYDDEEEYDDDDDDYED